MAVAEIDKLKDLSLSKQLVFSYLTSERFYSISDFFSREYKYGDSKVFKEAIEFVYRSIFNLNHKDLVTIQGHLQTIFKNTPGTNEFPTYHGTIAMYSGGIIYESINLLNETKIDKVLADISDMAINIVDCYIQERDNMDYDDEDFEERILSDGAMQTELTLQKGIISYLAKIDNVEPSDIDTLLEIQNNKKATLYYKLACQKEI